MDEDPALPIQDSDPFAKEREEYLSTIEELMSELMEAEEQRIEAINGKLEAEERLRQAEAPKGSAEERALLAHQGRRLAEGDLREQIKKAQCFERLYYEELEQKRLVQLELEEAKKRIAELEMELEG